MPRQGKARVVDDSSLSHHLPMPDPSESEVDLSTPDDPEASLVSVAVLLLQQGIALLKQTVRTDKQYSYTSRVLPGSSVGKHLRHILDHFRLLCDSLDNRDGIVNYDTRERDTPLETSRQVGLDTLRSAVSRFQREQQRVTLDKPLTLLALTPEAQELRTTFGRELWFAALHAIHHYSLIRVIVVGELNLKVPSDFGVAPSTLAFRAWSAEERAKQHHPHEDVRAKL